MHKTLMMTDEELMEWIKTHLGEEAGYRFDSYLDTFVDLFNDGYMVTVINEFLTQCTSSLRVMDVKEVTPNHYLWTVHEYEV